MPRVLLNQPTAVQARDEAHETPFRPLRFDPAASGARCIAQREPFQRSTRAATPDSEHARPRYALSGRAAVATAPCEEGESERGRPLGDERQSPTLPVGLESWLFRVYLAAVEAWDISVAEGAHGHVHNCHQALRDGARTARAALVGAAPPEVSTKIQTMPPTTRAASR